MSYDKTAPEGYISLEDHQAALNKAYNNGVLDGNRRTMNKVRELLNYADVLALDDTDREQVLNQPIDVLRLSVRGFNILKREGIRTVRDLIHKEEADLMAYRNMGQGSLEDIKEKLAGYGLSLGCFR